MKKRVLVICENAMEVSGLLWRANAFIPHVIVPDDIKEIDLLHEVIVLIDPDHNQQAPSQQAPFVILTFKPDVVISYLTQPCTSATLWIKNQ